ncbi:hypothetical protein vseg_005810 [Gypsophila vaccaria]
MEDLLLFRSTAKSADFSGVSSHIVKSNILTYAMLALLFLMMSNGTTTTLDSDYMGSDNDNDNDNNEDNSDSTDDNDSDSDNEDVLVYTYDNRFQSQGMFGFATDVSESGTWKEVANSLQDDYSIVYNLRVNYNYSVNDGNPRLCCFGYYARYFRYANPRSENDSGEPIQEFSPEQHDWLVHVRPYINRINLYKMDCNGY